MSKKRSTLARIYSEAAPYWWVVALVVTFAWLLVLTFSHQVFGRSLLPDEVSGGSDVKVVAREPGVGYDVLAFCNDPSTKVVLGTPMEVAGIHYVASRGQEQVDWKDSDPPGSNPNAVHYWIGPDGMQHSEAVEVTSPARDCFKKKLR